MPPKLREEALALLLEEREGKGAGVSRAPSAPTHMKNLLPTPRVRIVMQSRCNAMQCNAILDIYLFYQDEDPNISVLNSQSLFLISL